MKGAVQRTTHSIGLVDLVHYFARLRRDRKPMVGENPTYDQHAIVSLDFTAHPSSECATTRFNLPRCQRSSKSALKSSGSGRNHVVNSG